MFYLCVQDKTLQQVAELANIMSIDQLNIKIRRSLKGHNAKVIVEGHIYSTCLVS
jgi:hypothetical protein